MQLPSYFRTKNVPNLGQTSIIGMVQPAYALVKLIDKMSLGAGALKVEGPIAQKGSLTLKITMATKRASER